ncbi:hypothetical protein ACPOL_1179 [Acidisarcina polymorpha]|uniref:Uncharacterized protein n=1 Tax=Acidisarcina polymorpha TaxID=2211140 RepID=A0A2Z5FVJ1_9BACT|nr:hypothetical protein ACPOL_1179 [Acidisarcina polymorpha]
MTFLINWLTTPLDEKYAFEVAVFYFGVTEQHLEGHQLGFPRRRWLRQKIWPRI